MSIYCRERNIKSIQHCQDERCKRPGSCQWWWPCWGLFLIGSGLWHSCLCGRHMILERDGCWRPPTCPTGQTQDLRTIGAEVKGKRQETKKKWACFKHCFSCSSVTIWQFCMGVNLYLFLTWLPRNAQKLRFKKIPTPTGCQHTYSTKQLHVYISRHTAKIAFIFRWVSAN